MNKLKITQNITKCIWTNVRCHAKFVNIQSLNKPIIQSQTVSRSIWGTTLKYNFCAGKPGPEDPKNNNKWLELFRKGIKIAN